jgi:hypothetical protein
MKAALAATAILAFLAYGSAEAQTRSSEGGRKTGMVPDTTQAEANAPVPESPGLLFRMQVHVDSVAKMTPEQLLNDMDSHRQLTTRLLDQLGPEIRQIKSKKAEAWMATSEAVRHDLTKLPTLHGTALSTGVQDHVLRLRQLVGLGKRLMLGTK